MNASAQRNKQQEEVCLRKCKAARAMATRSRALVGETLKQMAQCCERGDYEAVRERWMEAQSASKSRQERTFATLDAVLAKPPKPAASSPPSKESSRSNSPSSLASADVLRGSSSDESAFSEAARRIGAKDRQTLATMARGDASDSDSHTSSRHDADAPVHPRTPTSIGGWISQLKREPQSDSEKASKFLLYEAYSVEVQSMRETLLEAHQECRPFFNYAAAADIKQAIALIDSRQAMTISNEPEWFVYHMMRVAERNNLNMARTFESIERAVCFEGASEGSECPTCLERFDTKQLLTLGCCHKVCNKCWQHWIDVMHALAKHPFCPVCCEQDFMRIVQSEGHRDRTPLGRRPRSPESVGGHALSLCASECWSDACATGSSASASPRAIRCFGDPWRYPERADQELPPRHENKPQTLENKGRKERKHKQHI